MNESTRLLVSTAKERAQQGDWRAAEAAAQSLLASNPSDASGLFLLGLARKLQHRAGEAERAFRAALATEPQRYDAAIELVQVLVASLRYGEALQLLDQHAAGLSNSPYYLSMAGLVCQRLGLHERAHGFLERAHRLQPDIEQFQSNLATANVSIGRVDEAASIYESLLKRYPRHKRYHFELANLRKATSFEHVQAMRALLSETDDQRKNIFLHYAIGKELEDLGEWDASFESYRAGASAAAAASPYRVETDLLLMQSVVEKTNASWMARTSNGARSSGPTPVFIVGLPRTGTTLLDRMLSSHPDITSVGESYAFVNALQDASGAKPGIALDPSGLDAAIALGTLEDVAPSYLRQIRHRLAVPCELFIDKFPENFMYLGWIARAFPAARLVLVKRDLLDTCLALYKQVYFRYSYTFEDLAAYVGAFERLVDHWASLLQDRLIIVRYEDLVRQPEPELRKLVNRIGLDFDPRMLDFQENQQPVFTASAVQVREPLHAKSVGKWKNYARHLAPLRDALAARGVRVSE